MLLTDLWKERMTESLQTIYHNQLNSITLSKILDEKINKSLEKKRTLRLRDVYRSVMFDIDFNEILKYANDNELVIGANGAFSESYKNKPSDISKLLMENMDGRAVEKKLAMKLEQEGKIKEAAMHDTIQTKLKEDTNSIYGVQSQVGSYLYNPDSASFITKQCQHLISEMLWSLEKFLGGNIQLESYNEAILYFTNILKTEKHYDQFKDYITYLPTQEDLEKRLLWVLSDMNEFVTNTHRIKRSLFYFIKNLNQEERTYLFYKNNLLQFLELNPKILRHFRNILEKEDQFLNPYNIPKTYENDVNKIFDILEEFVVHYDMTHKRIFKYKSKLRYVVILSDTDSVYVSYNHLMVAIKEYCKTSINPNTTEDDLDFKLVNTFATITSYFINKTLDNFMNLCNVTPPVEKYKVKMKNEFFFRRLLLYTGVKKNYSGYVLLREGGLVPPEKQISETGLKLTSSRIPKDVSRFQTELITNYILKAKTINPVLILNEIERMKQTIISELKKGNMEYGVPVRFAGEEAYKNPLQMQQVRLAEIWNRLYPLDQVLPGDTIMTFDTTVWDEASISKITDQDMRLRIERLIFADNYNGETNFVKRYGLKVIGVPRDGNNDTIPQWIVDIINFEEMAKRHLQSITDLLPSIGIKRSRISSTNFVKSNLISF